MSSSTDICVLFHIVRGCSLFTLIEHSYKSAYTELWRHCCKQMERHWKLF